MSEHRFVEDAAQVVGGGASAGVGFFFVRWLWSQLTGRLDRRQASQEAEENRLNVEWRQIREELKGDVAALKKQNEALRFAFHHVSAALIRVDPKNPALVQAEQLLALAFPIDLTMIADRAAAALDLDEERRTTGQ